MPQEWFDCYLEPSLPPKGMDIRLNNATTAVQSQLFFRLQARDPLCRDSCSFPTVAMRLVTHGWLLPLLDPRSDALSPSGIRRHARMPMAPPEHAGDATAKTSTSGANSVSGRRTGIH